MPESQRLSCITEWPRSPASGARRFSATRLWLDLTPKGYAELSRAWRFGARESRDG